MLIKMQLLLNCESIISNIMKVCLAVERIYGGSWPIRVSGDLAVT